MKILGMLILFTAIFSGKCSSGKVTLEGSLSMFGAEPFVQLALITEERERVFLDAEKEILDRLWTENKGLIKIEGILYEGDWYGQPQNFIKIEKWEWIED